MKTKRFLLITLLLAIGAQAHAYDFSSLKGTINCTSTSTHRRGFGNSCPDLDVNGSLFDVAGSITVVADGKGLFTSGSATYTYTQCNANLACYYTLTGGAYLVNADGTGTSATSWSLLPGSANCLQTIFQHVDVFSIPNQTFSTPPAIPTDIESGTCTVSPSP